PRLSWDGYWKSLGFPALGAINVTSTRFLEAVNALIGKERPAALRSYLSWHVVRALAPLLPKAFGEQTFAFEASLTGQKEQRARWKRCVAATDEALGELLGQPFVKERFTPESKEATERFVHEIVRAFARELEALDWMEDATKSKALEKLRAMA